MISIIKEVIGIDDIAKSIYGLAKNNNGYFKSPAQAQFLKGQLDRRDGVVGSGNTYGNSHTDFAEYDDKGIIKIERHLATTGNSKIIFQRKEGTNLTQADEKNIRFYKRKIKELEQYLAKPELDNPSSINVRKSTLQKLEAFKKALEKIQTLSYDERVSDAKKSRIEAHLEEIGQRKQQIEEIEQEMQEMSDDLKSAMEERPEKAESFQRIFDSMVEKYKSKISGLEETIERLQAMIEKESNK
jgi:chromosome segregation ATPase